MTWVLRPTNVAIAELPVPGMRSPLQRPCTARSTVAAGCSRIIAVGVKIDLPCARVRALGGRNA